MDINFHLNTCHRDRIYHDDRSDTEVDNKGSTDSEGTNVAKCLE